MERKKAHLPTVAVCGRADPRRHRQMTTSLPHRHTQMQKLQICRHSAAEKLLFTAGDVPLIAPHSASH